MNIGVIFAGGIGSRMGTGKGAVTPKQFMKVDNKPIIIHTLDVFEACEAIDYVSIACLETYIPLLQKMVQDYGIHKVRWIVPGGETGQLSIFNGLKAVYDDREIERSSIVLVHDAVRPMIDKQLLLDNIEKVKQRGNSVTVSPAIETIFMSENKTDIKTILNRDNAYHAKAPQCFRLQDLYETQIKAIKQEDINNWDSCSLMYKYGTKLNFVLGKSSNIKITTMEDFYLFETMHELSKRNEHID